MHLHMSAPKGVDAVKAFEKLCKFFDGIATFITTVLMIFLTVLITVSVISRWIFNSPITWQYEATLVCLSWVVFIGMSITFRQDEHMRLTFVSNAIKNIKIRNIWLALHRCSRPDFPGLGRYPEHSGGGECDGHSLSDDPRQSRYFLSAVPHWLCILCVSYYQHQL